MYAITADQVDSRHDHDRVEGTLTRLTALLGAALTLPPERTAGDELQLLTSTPAAALDAVLALGRDGGWSVGLGIGDVDRPLPTTTRAASGTALFAARAAVERAKHEPIRFALAVAADRRLTADDVEPLLAQNLRLRSRRTQEGWDLADLLDRGMTRSQAADALGISPQAVAKRYATAALGDDERVRAALVRLLADADTAVAA